MNDFTARAYLETSALRALGKRLAVCAADCCTSSLALIELLGRAVSSEVSYSRVVPVIRRVLLCNLEIEWNTPETVIRAAFPFPSKSATQPRSVERDLRILVNLLSSSDTLATFQSKEALLPLEHPSSWFAEYDRQFGELFVSTSRPFRRALLTAFQDPAQREALVTLGLPLCASFDDSLRWFQHHPFNAMSFLIVFAESLAEQLGHPQDHRYVDSLLRSYDGSIDLYLRARAQRELALMEHGNSPGRNDLLDITHLLYVPSRSGLVTNDSDLIDLALTMGVAVSQPVPPRAGV